MTGSGQFIVLLELILCTAVLHAETSDQTYSRIFHGFPSSLNHFFPSRGVRGYLMVNRESFSYNVDAYSSWSNWTDCSPVNCMQRRHKTCRNPSWQRTTQFKSGGEIKSSCRTKYIIENRQCSDIPECQLPPMEIPVPKNRTEFNFTCGVRPLGIRSKIIGGQPSIPHSWPWSVSISHTSFGSYACGGTLISPSWVLTAAHCLSTKKMVYYNGYSRERRIPLNRIIRPDDYGLKGLSVRIGDHNKREQEASEQLVKVSKMIIHPKFRSSHITNVYDAALLKLEIPLKAGNGVDFACLPTEDLPDNTHCTITGWGRLRSTGWHRDVDDFSSITEELFKLQFPVIMGIQRRNNQVGSRYPYSPHTQHRGEAFELREVQVPLINHALCRQTYRNIYIKKEAHVCAGEMGKDSCAGDSGGGLMCRIPGTQTWQIYGITSFGTSMGCGHLAGVYTKVSAITDWVDTVVDG